MKFQEYQVRIAPSMVQGGSALETTGSGDFSVLSTAIQQLSTCELILYAFFSLSLKQKVFFFLIKNK
uniref:Uncharacterized protein n=1 Tax=Anguilla anguilla TaxID=7936 RepID=A0A0E9WQA6_ANGAN